MDYEKKLEDALKDENTGYEVVRWIESNFPELKLKESEDERIRKDIMVLVKDWWDRVNKDNISTKEQMLAWLEKQGQTFTKKDVDDAYLKGISDAKNELEKQGEQKPAVTDFNAKDWYVSNVDGKIHDMTYNPTDKVEPKFREGDWIIHHGTENIYQVVAIIDNQYQLKYGDNYTIQNCADVDRCARLWNIEKKELKKLTQSVTKTSEQVWSKEDEEELGIAIEYLQRAGQWDSATWLQSLKTRVRPKQIWSDDDKKMLDFCIKHYADGNCITWLESLKDRLKGG